MDMDPDPQIRVGGNYSMVINRMSVHMDHSSTIHYRNRFVSDERWNYGVVHGWDRKDVPYNQYIGILVPGRVMCHSSVDNGDSNGTNLVSKSINNSLFARFQNNEAIFSKDYHICMGVNLNRTRGDDTSSERKFSL